MTTLGIATTGVEEELSKLGIPVFVIDGERTPTRSKVKKTMNEWKDAPFGLLIGTEMAHNILARTDGVIILSLDSLFSLPEYRNDEKVLTLVTEMAEKVKERTHGDHTYPKVLLQTRLSKLPVIKQLTSPSFREVFQTLLRERERFLLPPYYTVIKSSFENVSEELKDRIEKELRPHPIEWYEQGRGVSLLFIHVHEEIWREDEALRARIKLILSGCKSTVNPLHFFIK
jgi:primosomal protein N'